MITRKTLKFLKKNPEISAIINANSRFYRVTSIPQIKGKLLTIRIWKEGRVVWNIYRDITRSDLAVWIKDDYADFGMSQRGGAT